MRQRLERFSVAANFVLSCAEEESAVSRALQHLIRSKPSVILVASTTAPAGPEDVVGGGMVGPGGQLGASLPPREPPHFFLPAFQQTIPIFSPPAFLRSP